MTYSDLPLGTIYGAKGKKKSLWIWLGKERRLDMLNKTIPGTINELEFNEDYLKITGFIVPEFFQ